MVKSNLWMLDLQLFAEGGAAPAGGDTASANTGVTEVAAVPQRKGVKANPLANVVYGKQQEAAPVAEVQETTAAEPAQEQPVDLDAEYRELIKGKYKDVHGKNVESIVRQRLKSSQETVQNFEKLQPALDILAKSYNVDASNIDALVEAINGDDSLLSDLALESGTSEARIREDLRTKRENENLRSRLQNIEAERKTERIHAMWQNQTEQAKAVYPGLDFDTEWQNPQFQRLLGAQIDVKTAYEIIHKDEVIGGAMQYAAQEAASRVAQRVAANGARPVENGMSSQSTAVVKPDVSQLTKADMREINRRVARGERIVF